MPERSRQPSPAPNETQGHASYRRASGVRRIELPANEPLALQLQVQREPPPALDPRERLELRWRAGSATLLSCSAPRHDTTGALLDAICGSGARLSRCDHHAAPESGQCLQRLQLELPTTGRVEAVLERRLDHLTQA